MVKKVIYDILIKVNSVWWKNCCWKTIQFVNFWITFKFNQKEVKNING